MCLVIPCFEFVNVYSPKANYVFLHSLMQPWGFGRGRKRDTFKL